MKQHGTQSVRHASLRGLRDIWTLLSDELHRGRQITKGSLDSNVNWYPSLRFLPQQSVISISISLLAPRVQNLKVSIFNFNENLYTRRFLIIPNISYPNVLTALNNKRKAIIEALIGKTI